MPRADHALAEGLASGSRPGPGSVTVDLAVLGVPTFATSISQTGAHATPAAVRRALGRLSTWSASRRVDLAELLAPWDRGDVEDPDVAGRGGVAGPDRRRDRGRRRRGCWSRSAATTR